MQSGFCGHSAVVLQERTTGRYDNTIQRADALAGARGLLQKDYSAGVHAMYIAYMVLHNYWSTSEYQVVLQYYYVDYYVDLHRFYNLEFVKLLL